MTMMNNVEDFEEISDIGDYLKLLKKNTAREKNLLINEIETIGDSMVNEIQRKNKFNESKKIKCIKYIMKKSPYVYELKELLSYTYEDVKTLYEETKNKHSVMRNIIHLFGSN